MAIRKKELKQYYTDLNRIFFDGTLPDVEIITDRNTSPTYSDQESVICLPQANRTQLSRVTVATDMLRKMVHIYCRQHGISDYSVNDYFAEDDESPALVPSPRFIEEAEKRGLIGGEKLGEETEKNILDLVVNRKE